MQKKWAKITDILKNTIEQSQFNVWIDPLEPIWMDNSVSLVAPSRFMANFVHNRYFSLIESAIRSVVPSCTSVSFSDPSSVPAQPVPALLPQEKFSPALVKKKVTLQQAEKIEKKSLPTLQRSKASKNTLSEKKIPQPTPLANKLASPPHPEPVHRDEKHKEETDSSPIKIKPQPRPLEAKQLYLPTPLPAARREPTQNWRFSFTDFIVGSSNELAFAASKSMCNTNLNTDILFLNSSPGLGKTHLMHAVGKELSLSSNRAQPKVEYLTAEEFASRFIHAVKTNNPDSFKARYRNLDLLLLEDIHFLHGKEKTQFELLNTIKALQERGGKLVCTSSFSPKDLQGFDDQLVSRLRSGFISGIEKPDEETRRKIFQHKAQLHQVVLPQDVEDALTAHIKSDVRLIESCLQTLLLKAQLFNGAITMQMAWDVIASYTDCSPTLDLQGILQHVCQVFGLTKNQVLSNSRKQDYVSARYAAFYLARKHTDLSLDAIGQFFNRRHSTVLKGITQLEREISAETPSGKQLANTIAMIEKTSGASIYPFYQFVLT